MTTTMTMTTKTARFHAMWARLAALLALLLVMGVLAPHARAQTTSITFFHNDVLGSPAVATDASGAVVWKESYLPYGHRLQAPAAAANNKLWYAGKQLDPNTGLSYMGARYYSPVVGRFMGMDPKEFSPENPHSLNRYAYGNNNPYKYVDPDGKIAETVWDAFNLSIGFHSLVSNVRAGNWSGAAVDGVGMALDGVAAAVPLMPGGAAAGIAAYRLGNAAAKGIPADAQFAQKTYGAMFSKGGTFAGKSVDDVAAALRAGAMKPSDVPIDYIVRDGRTIILNTRSSQALEAAGVARSEWNAVNRTGNAAYEGRLTDQLSGNPGGPFDTVRRSGGQ